MPDNTCKLCAAKIGNRITHRHSAGHYRSPANRHGGQPGLWHDVRWSEERRGWVCDDRCRGGYGHTCKHIEAVTAILRDEFEGWLGEVPRHGEPAPSAVKRAIRLEDLYGD